MKKSVEKKLTALNEEVIHMWKLVISQLEKSKQSFISNDSELAREIISREKRVDAFEHNIDSDAENFIAKYHPEVGDLRLALSLIKISKTLERIGDFAAEIARQVKDDVVEKLSPQLIEDLQIIKMFDTLITMLIECFSAFESGKSKISVRIRAMKDEVDTIYRNSTNTIANYMQTNPKQMQNGLKILLLIRKLERIGEHCSIVVEDIGAYIDANKLTQGEKSSSDQSGT
jgi:phosphate transport system protein